MGTKIYILDKIACMDRKLMDDVETLDILDDAPRVAADTCKKFVIIRSRNYVVKLRL